MPVESNTYTMTVWRFMKANEKSREISSIVWINEDRAREVATRRYGNMDGWEAFQGAVPVVVSEVPKPGQSTKRNWRIVLGRTQSCEVDVQAETEDEAIEMAKEEDEDWSTDGGYDVESCEDKGPVEDEEVGDA